MPRARKGAARRQSKVRVFKAAKGYSGNRSKNFRRVKQTLTRAGVYSHRDRRQRKRHYRELWIIRITAACRMRGLRYSQFIAGLKAAAIDLNRKMLSEIAIADPATFDTLAERVREALAAKAA